MRSHGGASAAARLPGSGPRRLHLEQAELPVCKGDLKRPRARRYEKMAADFQAEGLNLQEIREVRWGCPKLWMILVLREDTGQYPQ